MRPRRPTGAPRASSCMAVPASRPVLAPAPACAPSASDGCPCLGPAVFGACRDKGFPEAVLAEVARAAGICQSVTLTASRPPALVGRSACSPPAPAFSAAAFRHLSPSSARASPSPANLRLSASASAFCAALRPAQPRTSAALASAAPAMAIGSIGIIVSIREPAQSAGRGIAQSSRNPVFREPAAAASGPEGRPPRVPGRSRRGSMR